MRQHEIALPSIPELLELYPCVEAVEWLEGYTDANIAWQECPRSDWFIWVLQRTNQLTPMLNLAIQLMVLDTPLGDGRKVLDLITDERSLAFIELKKRRLAGEKVSETVWWDAADAAAAAGWSGTKAASAANAAAVVAYAANAAAAYAAANAAAGWSGTKAANAAAAANANAAANAAAGWSGTKAARSWQANSIRSLVTVTT